MAQHVPFGIVASLINNLASLALGDFGRVYGLSAELDQLKTTLENIRAVLSDAEERQHKDRDVELWIRWLKEVVHDADNFFDDLLIEDLRRKVNSNHGQVRDFFSSKNQLVFRRKMARKIEKIRKKLDDVSGDMFKLNLEQKMVTFTENECDWSETSPFVLQSDIIGREHDRAAIIKLLMETDTDQNVSFLPVVGMGGTGKTTLAQLVYNDARVRNHFEIKMWVCVSEDFEVKTILNNMLKSLQGKEVGDLELDQLQWKLEKELNGRRFMLVLDDVWPEGTLEMKWDALRPCLMCGGEGSKILLTTRSAEVAVITATIPPYFVSGVSEEDSWALLRSIAFDINTERMSPNLVLIGKRIAQKCRGLPFAIRTMGCLLQSKNGESEWLSILNGEFWDQCLEEGSVMPILRFSYQNLSPGLRQCFAYCSLYPKDWMFEKDELIQLWMAQGYLGSSNETQSMEAVGNGYVETLLMRSFFKDPSVNTSNDKLYFTMHDFMHDLSMFVAGNDYHLESEGRRFEARPMHASFVSSRSVGSLESLDASKLRTVLGPRTKYQFVAIPSIIKDLKYVRALDLSCSSITVLPRSIDKLKHLRYLDLSFCKELICLPESIGNLVCLQTLKLCWCKKLVSGVEGITKLINLRLLDIECCKAFDDMMPAGLGKLTLLQSLAKFVVGDDNSSKSGKLNELKDLNNVRGDMRITNLGLVRDVASESQEVNLKAKMYIQLLELYWGNDGYDWEIRNKNSESLLLLDNLCPHQNLQKLTVHGYPGVQFSSWLSSLINIVEVNLLHFSDCRHLPPLERLPCLKTLHIRNMKELKFMYYEEMSDVFFLSLETLVLYDCKNLRGWHRLGDVNNADDIDNRLSLPPFPHLSSLQIWNCPMLTCMPTFPSVVKLELGLCSVKPMIETCLVQHQSSSFYPLSSLKYLDIGEEMDIEGMPMEWMQNLTSLEHLALSGSPFIAAVLQNLQEA